MENLLQQVWNEISILNKNTRFESVISYSEGMGEVEGNPSCWTKDRDFKWKHGGLLRDGGMMCTCWQ